MVAPRCRPFAVRQGAAENLNPVNSSSSLFVLFTFTSVASLSALKQTGTPKRPVAGVYNQITVKMTARLLLRVVVDEKLTAAVEEIFQVFESTIAKYEEEALSLQQEIERLRRLLEERVSNHQTGLCVVSQCSFTLHYSSLLKCLFLKRIFTFSNEFHG